MSEQPDPGESATSRLYRATLGEPSAGRYLPVFSRFDDQGIAAPTWNSAAALFTLGWLVHHRLWTALAGCAALAAVLGLAVAGLWQFAPGWPAGIKLGASVALVLGAMLMTGLWGTAWLHTRVRRRMIAAVERAATVDGACIVLSEEARERQRRNTWGLAGVLSVGLLAALLWQTVPWATFSGEPAVAASPPVAPQVMAEASGAAPAPAVADAVPPAPSPSPVVVTHPARADELPAPAPISPAVPVDGKAPAVAARSADPPGAQTTARASAQPADQAPVAAPATAPRPALASGAAKVRVAPSSAGSGVSTGSTPSPSKSVPLKAGAAPAKALPKGPVVPAAEVAPPPPPASASAPTIKTPDAVAPSPRASGASASTTTTNEIRPRVKGFGVAVGMFSVTANAERVASKLSRAGLPVLSDPVDSARGRLTRVRVGPFERREEAEAAAAKVKALGLEARLYAP